MLPRSVLSDSALSALLLSAGCAGGKSPAPEAAAEKPGPGRIAAARMAVEAAEAQVKASEQDLQLQEGLNRANRSRLEAEAKLADMKLAQFKEMMRKQRLDQAALEVQQAQDQIEDATDELEQLEKMYQGNELADQTKEIVLRRGRRGLERSRTALALKQAELRDLGEHALPEELGRLDLDAAQKRAELDRESQNAELQVAQKRTALLTARADLACAQEEFRKLAETQGK